MLNQDDSRLKAEEKIKAHFGQIFDEVIQCYYQGKYHGRVTDMGCPYTVIKEED